MNEKLSIRKRFDWGFRIPDLKLGTGTQPRRQGYLIHFTLADFFKGDHLFYIRSTNIITIQ